MIYNETYKYLDNINRNRFKSKECQEYLLDRKLKSEIISNGIVLPVKKIDNENLCGNGGILDSSLQYVKSSAQLAYGMKNRVNDSYDISNEDIIYRNEEVVYLNYFIHHWGHYLVDVVSRLWYVLENKNCKLVYTCKYGEEDYIKGNFLEFLKLLDIDEKNLILINKPTKFKTIIIPEVSMYPGKYYSLKYKEIFDYILAKVENKNKIPDNIYLSRRYLKYRNYKKDIGENFIEEIFNDNGFVSIYPEKLSLIEQLEYYKFSKRIISTSGTLAHNAIFCKNNMIILNKTCSYNLHQALINQITDAQIQYIDTHISLYPIVYGYGPFLFDINNELNQFCLNNNYNINIEKKYYLIRILNIIKFKCIYFIVYKIFRKVPDKYDISDKELKKYYKKKWREIKIWGK